MTSVIHKGKCLDICSPHLISLPLFGCQGKMCCYLSLIIRLSINRSARVNVFSFLHTYSLFVIRVFVTVIAAWPLLKDVFQLQY